jgi:hypothetical protein
MKAKTLISALRRYAEFAQPMQAKPRIQCDFLVIELEGETTIPISLDEAMTIAADELERRDLDGLKFRALVQAMKKHGMDGFYERVMREQIPDFG